MLQDQYEDFDELVPDEGDDTLEIPSCIESLACSCEQLQHLSKHISEYYIKYLLCYANTSEPTNLEPSDTTDGGTRGEPRTSKASPAQRLKADRRPTVGQSDLDLARLASDERILASLQSTLQALPLLSELNLFVERCLATIESTLKRATYYLAKASKRVSSDMIDSEFQLTRDARLNHVFFAIMDLIYALVSLDETIKTHTFVQQNLSAFETICKLVMDQRMHQPQNDHKLPELSQLPIDRLRALVEYVQTIQLTLCNDKQSLFQQCINQLKHIDLILIKAELGKGHKNLHEHLEDFILIQSESLEGVEESREAKMNIAAQNLKLAQSLSMHLVELNVLPTIYMTNARRRAFGLAVLYVLYCWIFKKTNRKVTRAVFRALQKVKHCNLLHLNGSNCYLMLDEFLANHLAKEYLESKVLKQIRADIGLVLKLDMTSEFDKYLLRVTHWLFQFKAETLRSTSTELDGLRQQMCMFVEGMNLVEEINSLIKDFFSLYSHHDQPVTKVNLILLIRLMSHLKAVEHCLGQNRLLVSDCTMAVERILRFEWRSLLLSVQKRLLRLGYADRRLDTMTILSLSSLCSNAINQLGCPSGRLVLSICLPMLVPSLSFEEVIKMNQLMDMITTDLFGRLSVSAHCGNLYWLQHSFSAFYNYAFEEDPCALDEIHYFHLALRDIRSMLVVSEQPSCRSSIDCSWLEKKRDEFLNHLSDELMDQFKSDFLDRICQELEIELRLQTHRDLHLNSHNPFRRHLYNFKRIFASSNCTFRIFDQLVSLRPYVEQYLNRVCFNLTTLAPYDWFAYDSMLNLASQRYNLKFVNSQLPTQTLDYGLDLLDISRNLTQFVSRYGYDLTNQLFVEKSSNRLSASSASSVISAGSSMGANNQSLNVLQIRHIKSSIQTHGFGVLNSSVNCTYQVMKRLINLFSKQISDEMLRTALAREHQRLISSCVMSTTTSKQPERSSIRLNFDRANKIAKKFKYNLNASLASAEGQQTAGSVDLDSIRQTITQLGNLLAFIRMLKSGALECASRSVDYLPDMDDLSILRLATLVKSEFRSSQQQFNSVLKAAENFDQCLADLEGNFSPRTNYFSIIIGLFTNILAPQPASQAAQEKSVNASLNESNQSAEGASAADTSSGSSNAGTREHRQQQRQASDRRDNLRLFYLLVPALTINYIEYILNCEERVSSRSSAIRSGALISDDGFSLGVAFLLTVLPGGQQEQLAALEWFKVVRGKLEEDKVELERRMGDVRYEESLRQTSSMTLRRLSRLRSAYDGLDYTLSSALLLLRGSTTTPPTAT